MTLKKITDIGFDLEKRRHEKGLTQIQVANEVGVSIVTYQRWEWGNTQLIKEQFYDKLVDLLA